MSGKTIEAELTWTGERFERGVKIEVDNGVISRLLRDASEPDVRLADQALLPGFVNAHSHAFQRGLRGRGERFPTGTGSFWSWREAMYQLVGELDHGSFYNLSLEAFREMRATGITSVGEFHYLHHDASSMKHDWFDYSYDELVLRAAKEAGIRIVVLNAFYRSGSIGQPPSPPQRRFYSPGMTDYWKQTETLQAMLSPMQTLGVVAHSIRAASPSEIEELSREALRRQLVFHMHLEEQEKEVEDAVAAYGKRPLEIVLERCDVNHLFTAVHATQCRAEDLTIFLNHGGNVCITPLTEANLGDGVPPVGPLTAFASQLSLGTDSNHRISFFEEMRWLEYAHRLATKSRGVFKNAGGSSAAVLFEAATKGGARSLGLNAGSIAEGKLADFVAIDLGSEQIAGWTDDTLLDSIVYGAGEEIVTATCVGGAWESHR